MKPKQNSLLSLWTKSKQLLKDFKTSLIALPSSCIKEPELMPIRVPVLDKRGHMVPTEVEREHAQNEEGEEPVEPPIVGEREEYG